MHVTDYEFLGANCIPLPQLYLRELTRPSSAEGLARETKVGDHFGTFLV